MRQASLYRYRLAFASEQILPDRPSHHKPAYREGLIVHLQQAEQQGWGEIAPLPGFSQESLAAAQTAAQHWLARWRDIALTTLPLPGLPSVDFGISCALAELAGQLPLAAHYHTVPLLSSRKLTEKWWLNGHSGNQPVNQLAPQWQNLHAVRLAKYKVARQPAQQDAAEINQLLSALPGLHLRLDANRGWLPQQAVAFVNALYPAHRSRIVFIEEPCHSVAQCCDFARDTGMAIAWDESLRECENGNNGQQHENHDNAGNKDDKENGISPAIISLITRPGVAALIIKPMLTGSLARVRQQIQAAHQRQRVAVISSAIESSLGLTQLARLAHWLTPCTFPGLDTLSLLDAQIIRRWPGSPLPVLTAPQLELQHF